MQAPGSSQAGSGRVSTRCVCVPACPFRRDFASAGRSPKAVPEKRVAAAAARETMAVRETASAPSGRRARFDGTLQAPGEARKRSQRNGAPQQQRGEPQQRGKQQCPQARRAAAMRGTAAARETSVHRKAGIQAAAPQAQRASNPTCRQSHQPYMQTIPAAQPVALPSASPASACLGLQVRSRNA